MNIEALIAATTAALNAIEADKFLRKSATCTDGDVECTMEQKRANHWGNAVKVSMRFKKAGKVISRAALIGRDTTGLNEALLAEFESRAPTIKASMVDTYTHIFNHVAATYAEKGQKIPAYPSSADSHRSIIRGTLSGVCEVTGASRMKPCEGWLELCPTKLDKLTTREAQAAAVAWFHKTNDKLGALENPELVTAQDGHVIVKGTRDGKAVSMYQQCIIKHSPRGSVFNQFPARIYVDDKFTTEADYKAMFR